jgi:hypothetical protein
MTDRLKRGDFFDATTDWAAGIAIRDQYYPSRLRGLVSANRDRRLDRYTGQACQRKRRSDSERHAKCRQRWLEAVEVTSIDATS